MPNVRKTTFNNLSFKEKETNMNNLSEVEKEYEGTISPADLAGFLYAVKLVQDEGGRGSVQIVLESGTIKDINTVIKPASESQPSQAQAEISAAAIPSVEAMRRNWQRFELSQIQRMS